jgi:hypothetical protein
MKLEDREPYWFQKESIKKIENHYGAKYMGYWCIRDKTGNWSDVPVEVFYQPNPDISKGHSHYFGLFVQDETVMRITNASSAFSGQINGILEDDIVYVSRYRHDFTRTPRRENIIDGGRDYLNLSGDPITELVSVTVNKDSFKFIKLYNTVLTF